MDFAELNGLTAIFGGLTGILAIIYAIVMIHYARKKDRDLRDIAIRQAKIEGMLLAFTTGGRK